MRESYVYIMASKKHGTLYIGVTSDLKGRVYKHRSSYYRGFTQQYDVHDLVYYEVCSSVLDALRREKQLKNWERVWKIELIEKDNPQWNDLFPVINKA